MSDLAWPVDGPNAMDLAGMKQSLHMHRQWTDTYAQRVQQEADLYANTSCMAACQSMQEALTKFRAKCEFLEKAYAQLIATDATSFERYNRENQEIIKLALKVNSKAGKAIKHVKTTVQANIQNDAQHRNKAVWVRSGLRPDTLSINATLIEFREWLTTFKSYFHGSNLQNDHINGQQVIYKQLLNTELRRRVTPECGADTPVFAPNLNPNNIASLISITEKYLKKEHPLNSCRTQWLRALQADGKDFNCFFRRILALRKESEAHTFDETAGNIMFLCAGATSDSFRRELRLKGRALTLENIQELADDSRRAKKEEQDMNALREEHIRAVGRGGARPRNTQTSHEVSSAASVRSWAILDRHAVEASRGRPPQLANQQRKVAHDRLLRTRRMRQCRPATNLFKLCLPLARLTQLRTGADAAPHLHFMYDYRRWAGQLYTYKLRRIPVRPSLC